MSTKAVERHVRLLRAQRTYLIEQDDIRLALLKSGATRDEIEAARIEHALRNGARLQVETYGWYAQWRRQSGGGH